MNKIKDVSPTAALALIKKGALLVDVRQPSEVARKAFDVPDTLQIPLGKIEQRFREIPENRQVIVACHSGNRSVMAARFLASHGFRKVVSMQHGIAGWERAGLPVRSMPKQSILSRLLQKFGGKS